jgi:hypothetical protein
MLATCILAGLLLNLFFPPWRWRRYVPSKRRLTLNGLHGVISQKMTLFLIWNIGWKFLWTLFKVVDFIQGPMTESCGRDNGVWGSDKRRGVSWLKSSILWDITLCFLLASRWFLAWLLLWSWRRRRHVAPKRRLTFNGLHGVISQKIELFITTAVRTSSPTQFLDYLSGC